MPLSHLNAAGLPEMVDVGDKAITTRIAVAEATVVLGKTIMAELEGNGFNTRKGSVIQTAVIAGTMAVKQTWSVIPLCHALDISSVKFTVDPVDVQSMKIRCTVKTAGRTGVEMEALHGASIAALTIYDMCKAMSHDIRIEGLQLVSKTGGKTDYEKAK
ncbi:cyclic pyranopterin monophosphate synthase MoaC [Neolewinella persica]|uniref:cyclic pyranopterin monophosphate synthase MoaC n=1 Tax=Neolewinella persica TaxID=70998 RepID=UPI000370740C|nr:cyclic pyranopterin monophosphate synthase MoaC [Neolewinella persica]